MCGIAGLYTTSGGGAALSAEVAHMLALERHRGPDDSGVHGHARAALGACRLSILDLSPAGHQPMLSSDASVWVVQNGEIYNFEELRRQLVAEEFSFRSDSDTEVLLHGYSHWGTDLFRRLRGMFAIAIWDERRQSLVLARDRFGIKGLYYRVERDGGFRLGFASEIKPVLAAFEGTPRANSALVYDFLAHGLLDHTDETFFEGVVKLPPAHYLVADGLGDVKLHRYWDFEVNPEIGDASLPADEAAAAVFREAFEGSVRHHLVSDVPVGFCLSGGLDSSAVVCVAARLLEQGDARSPRGRLNTFTSCFDDPSADERAYADEVVRATNAEAHQTFPTPEGFLAELPDLLRHQEEPFAGTSIYAQWCLMRDIHRAGLKVVLDGQGGDEQLLGYGKFCLFYLRHLFAGGRYAAFLGEGLGLAAAPEFWRSLDFKHGLRYMGAAAKLAGEAELVDPELRHKHADRRPAIGLEGGLAERIKRDLTSFSLPVLLRHEDKNSMAFSVEARVPFVDHVLVERIAGLPLTQKLRHGLTKYVLRRALHGTLPEKIEKRRSKFGFNTPEALWFRLQLADEMERTFREAAFLPQWADLRQLPGAFARFRRGGGLRSPGVFFRYYIVEKWAHVMLTRWRSPGGRDG